jgi:arginase
LSFPYNPGMTLAIKAPLGRTKVRLIGVPMDLGGGRRGVDMGPSAIRYSGIGEKLKALGYTVSDDGDVAVPVPEQRDPGDPRAKYLREITRACDRLRTRVKRSLEAMEIPVVIGGDHSIAAGSIAGVAEHYRERGQKIGLIWVDAHADMNTPETSPSGNIHGMPLAAVLGLGPEPLAMLGDFSPKVAAENCAVIGLRSVDEAEKVNVRRSGVSAYTMRDLDERGMREIIKEAIKIATAGTVGFHISFDLDGMDPDDVPGVGTAVKGGIGWREAQLLMETVADSGKMTSCEVTELNPIFDIQNRSGEVAVELILSAFGKSIL